MVVVVAQQYTTYSKHYTLWHYALWHYAFFEVVRPTSSVLHIEARCACIVLYCVATHVSIDRRTVIKRLAVMLEETMNKDGR